MNGCNFALMADECRDNSGTQELSIVIRFFSKRSDQIADATVVVKERFLGFVPLEAFDATTLSRKFIEFLLCLNIPLKSYIRLYSDG